MGMSKAIRLGIYIITDKPTQKELYDKIECPNGHKLTTDPKFCPECGSPTVSVEYSRVVDASVWDIVEDAGVNEDEFMVFDHDCELLIVPNGGGMYLDEFDGDLPLMDLDSSEELEKFHEEYGETIEKLRPYFTTFDVRFGISTWWW